MAKQKFGLGRGLDALLSDASQVMSAQLPVDAQTLLLVPIESIIPNPRQPRRICHDDDPALLELSASIKEHGLLQPIVVTCLASTNEQAVPEVTGLVRYQIIAGERRWRASRLAGLAKVPIVVKEVTSQQMLELGLIENIQRADLNPLEEALAYQTLIEEFGLTQEMVAKQVGKDRSTITNSLRLLQLPAKVREELINNPHNFTEGHARTLLGITRPEDQITAMRKIVTLCLNVRQAEELAASIKATEDVEAALERITTASRKEQRSAEVTELETQFRNALMVKVDLKCSSKGKGTLVLHFNNQDELESLYGRLVKQEE